jgi:hypothetical protein
MINDPSLEVGAKFVIPFFLKLSAVTIRNFEGDFYPYPITLIELPEGI